MRPGSQTLRSAARGAGALLGSTLLLAGARAAAAPADYEFRAIASEDEYQLLFPFSASLDATGRVAFLAQPDAASSLHVYLADGVAAPQPIADAQLAGDALTRINGHGDVAYTTTSSGLPAIAVLPQAGSPAIAVDVAGEVAEILVPFDFDDAGKIALHARFDDGDEGIAVVANGSLSRLASAPDAEIDFGPPAINAAGRVAVRAIGGTPFYDRILVGSAAPLAVVRDSVTAPFACNTADFCFGPTTDLNGADALLFNGFFNTGPPLNDEGWFVDEGGTLRAVADTTDGRLYFVRGSGLLNELGGVVFTATTGTDTLQQRLLTGPDPEADRVIGMGDPLLGSVVQHPTTALQLLGWNDAGQVLFATGLADGRFVLVRADPVPEPETVLLGLAVLGGLALVRCVRGG